MAPDPPPRPYEIQMALDVLLWLHEHTVGGVERDEISRVRWLLGEVLDGS
jgi:hypothetical protein